MKNLKRKLTAAILSVLLATSSFTAAPVSVAAATTEADGGIGANEAADKVGATEGYSEDEEEPTSGVTGDCTWELDEEGTLTISGNGSMESYDEYSHRPEWRWGYNVRKVIISNGVTTIGSYAFSGCDNLKSITIPDSVTSIGSRAFSQCTGLTSVTIPDSLTSIESGAFSQCTGLTSVTIPDSVTSIGSSAFSQCTGLTSVTIPDSVTSIGSSAFSKCTGLTSVTIPDSVTSIGSSAFSKCTGLTSIAIPNSVTYIGNGVFSECTGLTSINIPNSVTSIGNNAFFYCTSLTNVTIPNSVTSIGNNVFYSCTSLTNITISNSVTSIEEDAFYSCTSLTNVTIPDSVTSIGSRAFSGCTGLVSITIPDSVTYIGMDAFLNTAWESNQPDGVVYCGNVAYKYKGEMPSDTSIILKDGTKVISQNVFSGNSNLSSIVIPDSVNYIEDSAFENCTGLKSVTLSNNLTTIGDSTFKKCTGLINVIFPDNVTTIKRQAFCQCISLTSVTIPDSVTSIEFEAFGFCTKLTNVIIPDSVNSIENYVFHRCINLKSITFKGCVTNIEKNAFSGCGKLIDVNVENLKAWCEVNLSNDSNPFTFVHNLYVNNVLVTDLSIPYGVKKIGSGAFFNCTGLTSVTIPDSVTTIESGAFSGCTGLTNIVIPDTVTTIGREAFCNTEWYNNQTDGIIYAGKIVYKYKGKNSSETSIVINNGTKGIAQNAFREFPGLKSITIPNSVTSIDDFAFYKCDNLIDVFYYGTQESWDEINIGNYNENLTSANIHFITSPVFEHTYGEPVWTWDGYSAATATFTCAECDDVQEITANVTTEITKEPTCTETGIRTCTATVTFNGNTYTDTKEKTVPAKHSYSEPVWAWDGYSAATATFTCAECGDTQVKNANVTTKITTEPTCTETGIRTCTAKVTLNGKTFTDTKEKTISATGHSYGEPTWTWSGYSAAKATFTCAECNDTQVKNAKVTTKVTKAATCTETGIRTCTATITFKGKTYTDTKEKTIPAVHSYGEPTWTWSGYSSATATFTCAEGDDTQVKNAKVTTKVTKEPTVTTTGIRTCTATVTFNGSTYTDTKLKVIPKTAQSSEEPGSSIELPDDDPAPGALPFYVMGDANSDGVADIKDVTAIQCYLAGIKSLDSMGILAADVDGDEEVTIDDATEIQYYLSCFDFTLPIDSQVLF